MDLLDHVRDVHWAGCALFSLCLALVYAAGYGLVATAMIALRLDKDQLKANLVKSVEAHCRAIKRTEAADQALASAKVKLAITTQDAEKLRLNHDILQKRAQKQAEEMDSVALANTNLQDQLAAASQASSLLQQRLADSEASLDSAQARLLTAERVQHAAQSAAAELSDRVQELEAETLTLAQAQTAAAEEARKEKTMRAQYEEEYEVAAASITDLLTQLDQLAAQNAHLSEDAQQTKAEADARVTAAESRLAALEASLAEATQKLAASEHERVTLKALTGEQECEIWTHKNAVVGLKNEVIELKKMLASAKADARHYYQVKIAVIRRHHTQMKRRQDKIEAMLGSGVAAKIGARIGSLNGQEPNRAKDITSHMLQSIMPKLRPVTPNLRPAHSAPMLSAPSSSLPSPSASPSTPKARPSASATSDGASTPEFKFCTPVSSGFCPTPSPPTAGAAACSTGLFSTGAGSPDAPFFTPLSMTPSHAALAKRAMECASTPGVAAADGKSRIGAPSLPLHLRAASKHSSNSQPSSSGSFSSSASVAPEGDASCSSDLQPTAAAAAAAAGPETADASRAPPENGASTSPDSHPTIAAEAAAGGPVAQVASSASTTGEAAATAEPLHSELPPAGTQTESPQAQPASCTDTAAASGPVSEVATMACGTEEPVCMAAATGHGAQPAGPQAPSTEAQSASDAAPSGAEAAAPAATSEPACTATSAGLQSSEPAFAASQAQTPGATALDQSDTAAPTPTSNAPAAAAVQDAATSAGTIVQPAAPSTDMPPQAGGASDNAASAHNASSSHMLSDASISAASAHVDSATDQTMTDATTDQVDNSGAHAQQSSITPPPTIAMPAAAGSCVTAAIADHGAAGTSSANPMQADQAEGATTGSGTAEAATPAVQLASSTPTASAAPAAVAVETVASSTMLATELEVGAGGCAASSSEQPRGKDTATAIVVPPDMAQIAFVAASADEQAGRQHTQDQARTAAFEQPNSTDSSTAATEDPFDHAATADAAAAADKLAAEPAGAEPGPAAAPAVLSTAPDRFGGDGADGTCIITMQGTPMRLCLLSPKDFGSSRSRSEAASKGCSTTGSSADVPGTNSPSTAPTGGDGSTAIPLAGTISSLTIATAEHAEGPAQHVSSPTASADAQSPSSSIASDGTPQRTTLADRLAALKCKMKQRKTQAGAWLQGGGTGTPEQQQAADDGAAGNIGSSREMLPVALATAVAGSSIADCTADGVSGGGNAHQKGRANSEVATSGVLGIGTCAGEASGSEVMVMPLLSPCESPEAGGMVAPVLPLQLPLNLLSSEYGQDGWDGGQDTDGGSSRHSSKGAKQDVGGLEKGSWGIGGKQQAVGEGEGHRKDSQGRGRQGLQQGRVSRSLMRGSSTAKSPLRASWPSPEQSPHSVNDQQHSDAATPDSICWRRNSMFQLEL